MAAGIQRPNRTAVIQTRAQDSCVTRQILSPSVEGRWTKRPSCENKIDINLSTIFDLRSIASRSQATSLFNPPTLPSLSAGGSALASELRSGSLRSAPLRSPPCHSPTLHAVKAGACWLLTTSVPKQICRDPDTSGRLVCHTAELISQCRGTPLPGGPRVRTKNKIDINLSRSISLR